MVMLGGWIEAVLHPGHVEQYNQCLESYILISIAKYHPEEILVRHPSLSATY